MEIGLLYNIEYIHSLAERLIRFNRIIDADYKNKIIELAQHLCKNEVSFINDWDMESCTKYYKMPKLWSQSPNGDEEWVYSLNRMEYLYSLIFMYSENGGEKYIHKWNTLVQTQFEQNRIYELRENKICELVDKIQRKTIGQKFFPTNRTLDMAIRICVLSSGLLMWAALGIEIPKIVIQEIETSIDLLEAKFRPFDLTSNWGAIILSAKIICRCIVSLQTETTLDLLKKDLEKLEKVVDNQTTESGVHLESSLMYHSQVLIYLLKVIYYCSATGISVPEKLINKTWKMFLLVKYITPDDNVQVCFGDSDRTDISALIWLAGQVFEFDDKYEVKTSEGKTDYSLCAEIIPNYIRRIQMTDYSESYVDGGISVLSNNKIWYIACFNTKHISGHSHGDMGEIILYYKGIPVFVDGGRFSYKNITLRRKLKSPLWHSVVVINKGCDYNYPDAWICKKHPEYQKNAVYSGKSTIYFAMAYQSVLKDTNIHICRIVMKAKEHIFIVDMVESMRKIKIRQNYILGSYIKAKLDGKIAYLSYGNNKLKAISSDNLSIEKITISEHYNETNSTFRLYSEKKVNHKDCIVMVVGEKVANQVKCEVSDIGITVITDNDNREKDVWTFQKDENSVTVTHKNEESYYVELEEL